MSYAVGMGRRQPTVSERIREAIEACGETRYRVAKETGVSQTTLSRFFKGERTLSQEAIDALAGYLGLDLVPIDGKNVRAKR